MVEQTRLLTIEEFIRLYDQQPFEIINGRHITLSPTVFGHSKVIKRIYDAFFLFNHQHAIGEVFTETVFILQDKSNWVAGSRVPDVMFIRKERLEAYEKAVENANSRPLALVPDLVVEVISATDSYTEVNEKIEAFLADGVKIIWVVDPQRKRIAVYEGSNQPVMLGEGDTLSGGDVVPGFELKVGEVFD